MKPPAKKQGVKGEHETEDILAENHQTMLEKESGIKPEVIEARAYKTVTVKSELERLGFSRSQCLTPTLLIPVISPSGDISTYQARPNQPRIDKKKGKPIKYETLSGSSMALDVHPFNHDKIGDPKVPLYITEGIKKGDCLTSHGLCTVSLIGVWNWRGTNDKGGKTVLPDWEHIALNDRNVFIVFDSDVMTKQAVYLALERLKAWLESRGAKVSLIYLPYDDGSKTGVDDFLASGKTVNDLLALVTDELKPAPKAESKKATSLPEIDIHFKSEPQITAEVKAALEKANRLNPIFYKRGDALLKQVSNAKVEPITQEKVLKVLINRVCTIVDKSTPKNCPDLVATALLHEASSLDLPELTAISTTPLVLPDGKLILNAGFEAGYLLDLKHTFGSSLPLDQAKQALFDLIADFPFGSMSDVANFFALLIQPYLKPIFNQTHAPCPMYGFVAPKAGTGKSLLAKLAVALHLSEFSSLAHDKEAKEFIKEIFAQLLGGAQHLIFDNAESLNVARLYDILTSGKATERLFHTQKTVTVRNDAVWLFTGNNPTFSDELARRIVPIELIRFEDDPTAFNDFKYADVLEHLLTNIEFYVSCILSILQAWVNAGMPKGNARLASFERWAAITDGVLKVAGIEGFLDNLENIRQSLPKLDSDYELLIREWFLTYGSTAKKADDLRLLILEKKESFSIWASLGSNQLYSELGKGLQQRRNRTYDVNGQKVVLQVDKDKRSKTNTYTLKQVESIQRFNLRAHFTPEKKNTEHLPQPTANLEKDKDTCAWSAEL